MSVDSTENKVSSGWAQSGSTSNYDNNGTNQWLVNSNEKVCGSWAQAVSGGCDTSNSTNSNIPNNQTNKLNTSNQSDHLIDENGSQNNQILSSHFNFELDPNDLYSTKWGKSVIDHDNAWCDDLSPSSANNAVRSSFDFNTQMRSNNGTELWENNLRQTKELQGNSTNVAGLDLQSQSSNLNQQSIEQSNTTDTQWSTKMPIKTTNHFGGHWMMDEQEDLTNVWTGIPTSNSQNNLTNQAQNSQMNTNSSTSTSNVFNNNRQPNSINCDKGNLQLLSSNSNSNNKNWISDDTNDNQWGESIKTNANEWVDASAADISMLNLTPKQQQQQQDNNKNESWTNYNAGGKLNSTVVSNQATAGWSNDVDKTMMNVENDIDNGTSLWGTPQGQNKVLLWKEENKQRNNNSQAIINNVEQWKKYSVNGNNVPTTSSNLPWNNNDNLNSADESEWAKNKRKLTKEMIASRSEFRILVEMGFKEEDVENSLRNTNMNLQESIEELRLNTLKETGMEMDRRKQQAQNSTIQGLPSVNNMLRNNVTATKLPNQSASLPSEKLLSHLVQQIQLAVQSGHLNPQILNQQLAPSTITLIYQLLQQIKLMQSLQSGVTKNYSQNFYQVNQCKQKIAALQKQINVQQALLFKQQQMQQQSATGNNRPNTANQMMNNNLGNLVNDLSNLQLNQQNQSRLNQWKLPSNYDKDDLVNYDISALANTNPQQQQQQQNDFSRAPGPSTKQQQQQQQQQAQFLSQNSWTNTTISDDSWQNKNQLSTSAPQQLQINPNTNYGEMVGDFANAANKQWKETMMNNNPQIDQMYNWSAANKLVDSNDNLANASNNFNSNTWTFSNSNAAATAAATPQNAIWTNNQQTATANHNNNNPHKQSTKGPPPGLGSQVQQQKDLNQNSSFLLIRNLTLQIDESILKTLCRQHGSLLFFHMFLNIGLAIVKYSSKDEAMKAQQALNNCSLGNTTIQVQIANESEVQQYLSNCQLATNATSTASSIYPGGNEYMIASNNAWTSNNGGANQIQQPNTSTMWSFNQQPNNLWNIDQNSNSALHNLLPDNLLNDNLLEST